MTYLGIKMEKMRTEKSGMHSKLKTKKWKVLNGRRYKEFLSSQARNAYLPGEYILLHLFFSMYTTCLLKCWYLVLVGFGFL